MLLLWALIFLVLPWQAEAAPTKPTVTTQSASSVTDTTATLNGTIVATSPASTVRGFSYGTDSTLATVIATTTDTAGQPFGAGAFTGAIASLTSCGQKIKTAGKTRGYPIPA